MKIVNEVTYYAANATGCAFEKHAAISSRKPLTTEECHRELLARFYAENPGSKRNPYIAVMHVEPIVVER